MWLLNLHTKVQSSVDFTKCCTILLASLLFGSHIKGQHALLSQGLRVPVMQFLLMFVANLPRILNAVDHSNAGLTK